MISLDLGAGLFAPDEQNLFCKSLSFAENLAFELQHCNDLF